MSGEGFSVNKCREMQMLSVLEKGNPEATRLPKTTFRRVSSQVVMLMIGGDQVSVGGERVGKKKLVTGKFF